MRIKKYSVTVTFDGSGHHYTENIEGSSLYPRIGETIEHERGGTYEVKDVRHRFEDETQYVSIKAVLK